MFGAADALLILALAFYWVVGSVLVGAVAFGKGRYAVLWGLGAFFLFSPLLALIALAALPSKPRETDAHRDDFSEEEPVMRWRRLP